MLTLAIGIGAGMAFFMGLCFAIGNACDVSEAQYKREEELELKKSGLISRYNALCTECDRLLTKAEDCSNRAYAERSERWSELADSYLEQYDVCRNELEQVEKMIYEIN